MPFYMMASRRVASREQSIHAIVTEPVGARRDCPFAIPWRGKITIFVVLSPFEFLSSSLTRLLFLSLSFFPCVYPSGEILHPS